LYYAFRTSLAVAEDIVALLGARKKSARGQHYDCANSFTPTAMIAVSLFGISNTVMKM
jgi:hypothetical protein